MGTGRRDGRNVYLAWRSEGWQGLSVGTLMVFKYMKACCENCSEQMFSLFTEDETKQGMGLPFRL